MKKRTIGIIILSVMLLAGCSSREAAMSGEDLNPVIMKETQEKGEQADTATHNSQAQEQGSAEQEAYVLEFEASTITGETVTDDCFGESRLTMLNIWATYCNPCLSEMPDLGAIAAAYDPAEFQMYGIISDVTAESEDAVIQEAMDLIEQTGAAYSHLLLNESLYINLVGAASAVPTTFFVNQKGEVLGYVVGARSKEVWEEVINELLEQNP